MREKYEKIIRIIDIIHRQQGPDAKRGFEIDEDAQFIWCVFSDSERQGDIDSAFGRTGIEYCDFLYMPCGNCGLLLRFEKSRPDFGEFNRRVPSSFRDRHGIFDGQEWCRCSAVTKIMARAGGDRSFHIAYFKDEIMQLSSQISDLIRRYTKDKGLKFFRALQRPDPEDRVLDFEVLISK